MRQSIDTALLDVGRLVFLKNGFDRRWLRLGVRPGSDNDIGPLSLLHDVTYRAVS